MLAQIPLRKKLRIAIVDCGHPAYVASGILDFVQDLYDIEITEAFDADYVFHSCMGYEVLKYGGVRIFVCGEMVSPDLNISDYALAFDQIDFGDRCFWLPLIKLYPKAYDYLRQPREPLEKINAEKTEFCAYVMSNTKNSASERVEIFDKLNAYKAVSSGGRWRNNIGAPVEDKLAFQRSHKFAIAFENQSHPGYLTEKLAEAAAAGAIPIYWGDPKIAEYINPRAFINCHDYPSIDAVVAHVVEVDQDDEIYKSYMTAPWFKNGREPAVLRDETIIEYLQYIFEQPLETAYRRNRGRWGQKYEQRLARMWNQPFIHALQQFRNKLRNKR